MIKNKIKIMSSTCEQVLIRNYYFFFSEFLADQDVHQSIKEVPLVDESSEKVQNVDESIEEVQNVVQLIADNPTQTDTSEGNTYGV